MPNNNRSEKRQDVRVIIETRAKVRMIEPQEVEGIRCRNTSLSHFADYMDRIEESQESVIHYLVEYLDRMDEKLERIIDALDGNRGRKELQVKQTIDISGSGISFVLQGPVEKGQILDISLKIPGFPIGRFYVYGEVVHSRPHQGPESGFCEVGIKFIKMTPEQREALIACAFRQQRKMIRRKKDTTG